MSDKIQVTLKDGEKGRQEAFVTAQFSLGEVYPADSLTMRFGAYGTKEALKASMKHTASEGDNEGFDNALEEYCRMWMMENLGVNLFPLKFNDGGAIEGFKGDYDITEG